MRSVALFMAAEGVVSGSVLKRKTATSADQLCDDEQLRAERYRPEA
jgi:hypothetical protein